jgi:membrane peptidoglycan carboxypeptidase
MHTSCTQYGIGFPKLDLAQFPKWKKLIEVVKFLPVAYKAIAAKRIRPTFTFHFADGRDNFIGIAGNDICYPALSEDVEAVCRLAVKFEDRRFYEHHGIDLFAIIRSTLKNLRARRIIQGGSTITQQLARNTLLTSDRSFARKLAEMLIALKIERHYSKREILFLYSHLVYLGRGIRGFPAASKLIYRKPLRALDENQACGLIGLLRQPSATHPSTNLERYLDRQAFLVSTCRAPKKIVGNDKDQIRSTLQAPNPIEINGYRKARWSQVAERFITEKFSDVCSTSSHPVRVGLTIDQPIQRILDEVLKEVSSDSKVVQTSGVILSNHTADVLAESAWESGREWDYSPTFFGKIQPGSTFKTFAYLAALEGGFNPDLQLESNVFESSFVRNQDGNLWRVRNYGDIYRGNISLFEALQYSDNTAFARLAELIDFNRLESTYLRFGLCKGGSITPAVVLGASKGGVTLLSLASAYASIARNGLFKRARFIRYAQYSDNSILHFLPNAESTVVIRDYANIVKLKEVLKRSESIFSTIGLSGKTGTTKKGSLFVGYNDKVSIAIWLGYRDVQNEHDKKGASAIKATERFIQKALGYRHDLFTI